MEQQFFEESILNQNKDINWYIKMSIETCNY